MRNLTPIEIVVSDEISDKLYYSRVITVTLLSAAVLGFVLGFFTGFLLK
jgi:hypothetical protein